MEHLQYPIGRFDFKKDYTDEDVKQALKEIKSLPSELRAVVEGHNIEKLNTPYREGGWTVKQVVHHLADSHMNGYMRIKMALTSVNPDVVLYDEASWAETPDANSDDISASLKLLEGLHTRLSVHLESLIPEDFERTYNRPGVGSINLKTAVNLYAWHGRHHVGNIKLVK